MHFARITSCNEREMIAEVQSYIFRNRSRCQVLTHCNNIVNGLNPGVHLTLKMTSAQVVETSVNVISNSPSQDYTHLDDRTLLYDVTILRDTVTTWWSADDSCFSYIKYILLVRDLGFVCVLLYIARSGLLHGGSGGIEKTRQ